MTITAPITGTLQHAVVSGVVHEGITVQTRDGRRAGQARMLSFDRRTGELLAGDDLAGSLV